MQKLNKRANTRGTQKMLNWLKNPVKLKLINNNQLNKIKSASYDGTIRIWDLKASLMQSIEQL